ncbi:MAG: hypothetical protein IKD20_06500 [Clostridia bacterium]|nr:hypothetical protein [Clostridia bacterium]
MRDWDENKHPRNALGEFTNKSIAELKSEIKEIVPYKKEPIILGGGVIWKRKIKTKKCPIDLLALYQAGV